MTTDPLSELVALLSVERVSWSQLEASGRWALRFPARAMLKFVRVERGGCYAAPERSAAIDLQRDDMLMLLDARAYVVASDEDAPIRDGAPLFADGPIVTLAGQDTVLSSVHYTLASANLNLLIRLLPRFFHVPAAHPASAHLRSLNDLLLRELRQPGLGSTIMVKHLCEMLLLQTLRAFALSFAGELQGWLGGLADDHVGRALALMHATPAHSFTLEHLAKLSGLSRSALAARFRDKVGMPPLRYLTWWRMQLARRALETGKPALSTLARDLGYSTESAFSTAFKREFGTSPRHHVRATAANRATRADRQETLKTEPARRPLR